MKICRICEVRIKKIEKIQAKIFKKFEFGAVQRNANLVELEKTLQNASFLAIVAVDTAQNEPSKV